MSFTHPITEKHIPMFSDVGAERTMFRIVVKSNLTMPLARDLLSSIHEAIGFLDQLSTGFLAIHAEKTGKKEQGKGGHAC